jgi:Zn-dependent M16 (insulinase) family peptidase
VCDVESGIISFKTARSPNTFKAFVAAKKLISEILDQKVGINETTIASAKSTLVYKTAADEPNGPIAVSVSTWEVNRNFD